MVIKDIGLILGQHSARCSWIHLSILSLLLAYLGFIDFSLALAQPAHRYVDDITNHEVVGEVPGFFYQGKFIRSTFGSSSSSGRLTTLHKPWKKPSFRADRLTDVADQPTYSATFSPSVAPFKRLHALDTVVLDRDGHTPVLSVSDSSWTPVPIEDHDPHSQRDRFVASLRVDFSKSRRMVLPSVAPDARILRLQATPELALEVYKDKADNYLLVFPEGVSNPGLVQLQFLTDAHFGYWNASLAPIPTRRLKPFLPPRMPSSLRSQALKVAAQIGIRRRDSVQQVITKLTAYFRAFAEKEFDIQRSKNIYVDLALGRRGICRHRSYAFVITAQALGIPSRFVYNEAHAWVEAMVAPKRWMRIDLGGSTQRVNQHGLQNQPSYRPRLTDPLPRPPSYIQSLAEAARNNQPESPSNGGRDGKENKRQAIDIKVIEMPDKIKEQRSYRLRGRVYLSTTQEPASGVRIEIYLGSTDTMLAVALSDKRGIFAVDVHTSMQLRGQSSLRVMAAGDLDYLPATID